MSKRYEIDNITTWTWQRFLTAKSLWYSNKNLKTLEVFYGPIEAYGNYYKRLKPLNMFYGLLNPYGTLRQNCMDIIKVNGIV